MTTSKTAEIASPKPPIKIVLAECSCGWTKTFEPDQRAEAVRVARMHEVRHEVRSSH